MKKLTPAQLISKRIEKAFTPDLTFTWDKLFRCYIMKAETERGVDFRTNLGLRMDSGKLIPKSLFEEWYNSALRCQLTCQVIEEDIEESLEV